MALSGRINGSVTLNSWCFSYYILWSATQDPIANTSTVTATTYWSTSDLGMTFDTVGSRDMSITIDGTTSSTSKRVVCNPWASNGIYEIQTATKTVTHGADGTKSITISARSNGTASSYGPSNSTASSGDCTASATITLDAIDRTTPSVSLSLASRTANSLVISATATASCDLWEYTLDSGTTWTSFSTTDATAATCTLTGLNPGQSYTVQIRGQKTYNHLVGTSSASTYTTLGAATLNSVGEFYADASTVSINLSTEVYNASYTYSLDIKNGSTNYLSITGITAKPVGTQNFTITLSSAQRTTLLNAMANVASFSATFVLTTLNNGTTIGTSSATANIKTTTSSAPTQPTFSFKDSNASTVAVTGDNTKLVQGQSTLQITSLSATAKNGASIASYTIVVGGVTVTANTGGTVNVGAVSQSGTLSCRITAKDTRGYTSTATQNITCYPYAVPNVSSSAIARDDIDTTHVSLNFSGTFSTVGSNTVTAKYKYKKTSAGTYSADTAITLTKSGGTFSFSNNHLVDFDQDDSYDFVLTVSDSLNNEVYYYTVPSYSPLIAYRREGIGINRVPRAGYSLDVHGKMGIDEVADVGNDLLTNVIFHGTCPTAAATTAKVATVTGTFPTTLSVGTTVMITFANANSGAVADLTLNVNSTGAFPIKYVNNSSFGNLSAAGQIRANSPVMFVYTESGTNKYWVATGLNYNNTYSSMSEAEAIAGTATTARSITAQRLDIAIKSKFPYITEEGTDGDWTYRKWSSGTAECWCKKQWNVGTFSLWSNGVYQSSARPYWTFPSGLFLTAPVLEATHIGDSGAWFQAVVSDSGTATLTNQHTNAFVALRPNDYGGWTLTSQLYARGNWK